MRITEIDYQRYELTLTQPYTIAYQTISAATNFVLRLQTNRGLEGFGCAAPDKVVTGEVADDVESAIRNVLIPGLRGEDVFTYARLLERFRTKIGPSALAMLDSALYDLLAKRAEVPLYKLLGGYRKGIPTSVTIGIVDLTETLSLAADWVGRGFTMLKIKGGLELSEDVERLRKVRERYPQVVLRFDGNQGYDLPRAIEFVRQVEHLDIEIFEQPLPVAAERELAALATANGLPVMADESLKTLADAFRLTRHNRSNMINIKLQKVGGIYEALSINSVARAGKNEVMIGCLDECSLGIAAGLHFALSRPNIRFADLDGHLEFERDPFLGIFRLENGVLYPTDKPGLGL
jgi:L-alanine-DL-glutamate epimerase-like enolase superfamily enzyme